MSLKQAVFFGHVCLKLVVHVDRAYVLLRNRHRSTNGQEIKLRRHGDLHRFQREQLSVFFPINFRSNSNKVSNPLNKFMSTKGENLRKITLTSINKRKKGGNQH